MTYAVYPSVLKWFVPTNYYKYHSGQWYHTHYNHHTLLTSHGRQFCFPENMKMAALATLYGHFCFIFFFHGPLFSSHSIIFFSQTRRKDQFWPCFKVMGLSYNLTWTNCFTSTTFFKNLDFFRNTFGSSKVRDIFFSQLFYVCFRNNVMHVLGLLTIS